MPILEPTEIFGRIVWMGYVPDRKTSLRAMSVESVQLTFAGIAGECHGGLTRPSCSRVKSQYPQLQTEIRNVRQMSIVSQEELAATAQAMGIEKIAPEWVGASIVVAGIPDFTQIPPSSRLIAEAGTSITVDMENAPCQWPGKEIEQEFPGKGKGYKPAAKQRRGVTAWVEREGPLAIGNTLRLHVPPQRLYPHI